MTLIYRAEKGSPLTAQEIDNNFKELESRLLTLEEQAETTESLGKIHIEGDKIHFKGTFGKDFGTFTLPHPTLNPRGGWVMHTPYKKLDVVTFDNSLYCCTEDHLGTTWEKDQAYWKLLLSFPQPLPSTMTLYEKETLPETEGIGKLALLLEKEDATLIFFSGKNWQRLQSKEKNNDRSRFRHFRTHRLWRSPWRIPTQWPCGSDCGGKCDHEPLETGWEIWKNPYRSVFKTAAIFVLESRRSQPLSDTERNFRG